MVSTHNLAMPSHQDFNDPADAWLRLVDPHPSLIPHCVFFFLFLHTFVCEISVRMISSETDGDEGNPLALVSPLPC